LSTEPSTAWVQPGRGATGDRTGTPTNPLSLKLLATLWPSSILNLPATSNNYFATVPGTGYSYNGVVKVDHNFNAKNHLSLHWFAGEGSQTQPPGASLALATASSNLGYYFEVAPIHVQNYSAVLNSVLTERAANQLLFGVSYFNQVFHDSNNSFDSQALGLIYKPGRHHSREPHSGRSQHSDRRLRSGWDHPSRGPQRCYRTSDGYLLLRQGEAPVPLRRGSAARPRG
jgi:hypothetical protein